MINIFNTIKASYEYVKALGFSGVYSSIIESFRNPTTGMVMGVGGVILGVLLIESNPINALFNTIVGTSMVTLVYIQTYTVGLKKQLDSIEEKINQKTML